MQTIDSIGSYVTSKGGLKPGERVLVLFNYPRQITTASRTPSLSKWDTLAVPYLQHAYVCLRHTRRSPRRSLV